MQSRIAEVATGGLKTAVVGGAVGMIVGVVSGLVKTSGSADPSSASVSKASMVSGDPLTFLTANVELYGACSDMSAFKHHAPAQFQEICISLDKFCEVSVKMASSSPEQTRMSWPVTATRHARRATEAMRVMRKKLEEKQTPSALVDFDEIKARIHEELGNLQYNLTMEGASRSAIG